MLEDCDPLDEGTGISLEELVNRPGYVPEHDETTIPDIATLNEWWASDEMKPDESPQEWWDRREVLQFLSLATVPRVATHLGLIGAVLMDAKTGLPVDIKAHRDREAKSTRITGEKFHRQMEASYDKTFKDLVTETLIKKFLDKYGMYERR